MKQILHWTADHSNGNTTEYWQFFGFGTVSPEQLGSLPWSVTGSFSNLKITSTLAPGAGRAVTFTLMVNGVAQSLTVTITHPATSATDVVNTVAVVPGDVVCLRRTNTGGAPTWGSGDGSFNVEFDSADDHESGYNQSGRISFGIGGIPLYHPISFPKLTVGVQWAAANTTLTDSVFPLAGAITRADFCYRHSGLGLTNYADMVTGDSVEFVMLKNGIVQDGTSGTTDTRVTFAYPATAASWTGSLAVAAGDLLKWRATPTNMVDDDGDPYGIYTSIRFYSTTAHRFWLGGYLYADETTTRYGPVAAVGVNTFGSNTETVNQGYGSINTWYMIAIQSTGEVGTAHWIIDGRLNSTSPVGAPSVGVLRTTPYGPLTEIFQVVAVGSAVSPGGSFMTITNADNWTLRFLPTVPARTCTVFGINTTIDGATRAVAFGLDNNTNVHTETGKAKVFGNFAVKGYFELQPITAPAVGTGARIYVDTADGDLKVIFPNGTVRTIDVN